MPKSLFILSLAAANVAMADTVLHYRVSDTDADTVATGTIPGVDGSQNGTVAFGQITLSEDVPVDGVPPGAGNRSLVFDGASGINLPGTQQLLNAEIDLAGGFTYEAWFNWGGGGQVNSIIDYAGTEKLVRESAGEGAAYRNNSAAPLYPLGLAVEEEWHYAAVVFTPTEPLAGVTITGNFTFYYDSVEPTETIEAVTITDFGDSLNRTIAVGAHPVGFGGDFITGLIYEPRVSLGALSPEELLFASPSSVELKITEFEGLNGANRLLWTSRPGQSYLVEYSLDLIDWVQINGPVPADSETTEFIHTFDPGFEDLADEPTLFYRVLVDSVR